MLLNKTLLGAQLKQTLSPEQVAHEDWQLTQVPLLRYLPATQPGAQCNPVESFKYPSRQDPEHLSATVQLAHPV